jgi:hypothetical protein
LVEPQQGYSRFNARRKKRQIKEIIKRQIRKPIQDNKHQNTRRLVEKKIRFILSRKCKFRTTNEDVKRKKMNKQK